MTDSYDTDDLSTFTPDWKSPPGDTIKCVLEDRKITVEEFIEKMSPVLEPHQTLCLLEGYQAITLPVARKLKEVIGSTWQFWLAREADFRELQECGRPGKDTVPVLVYMPKPLALMVQTVNESGDRFLFTNARMNNDNKGFPTQFSLDVATGKHLDKKREKAAKSLAKRKAKS